MNYTTNYNLKKPTGSDYYNVADSNDNMDILDSKLNDIESDLDSLESNSSTMSSDFNTHKNSVISSQSGIHDVRYYNDNLQVYNSSNETWEDAKLKINNIYTATLSAGNTSVTISNSAITTNSILSFYTSVYGINPKSVSVSNGSVTLTFDSQQSNIIAGVKVDG